MNKRRRQWLAYRTKRDAQREQEQNARAQRIAPALLKPRPEPERHYTGLRKKLHDRRLAEQERTM